MASALHCMSTARPYGSMLLTTCCRSPVHRMSQSRHCAGWYAGRTMSNGHMNKTSTSDGATSRHQPGAGCRCRAGPSATRWMQPCSSADGPPAAPMPLVPWVRPAFVWPFVVYGFWAMPQISWHGHGRWAPLQDTDSLFFVERLSRWRSSAGASLSPALSHLGTAYDAARGRCTLSYWLRNAVCAHAAAQCHFHPRLLSTLLLLCILSSHTNPLRWTAMHLLSSACLTTFVPPSTSQP